MANAHSKHPMGEGDLGREIRELVTPELDRGAGAGLGQAVALAHGAVEDLGRGITIITIITRDNNQLLLLLRIIIHILIVIIAHDRRTVRPPSLSRLHPRLTQL